MSPTLWCPTCERDAFVGGAGTCSWCGTVARPKRGGIRTPPRLTDGALVAAHLLHLREGLSARRLGDLLWERHGFASAESCRKALVAGWKRLGLSARPHGEAVALDGHRRRLPGSPGVADNTAYKRWQRARYRAAADRSAA